MKEWWNQLPLRDKRAASLGMAAIIIALFYVMIWMPLTNKNELLRTQIQHDKQLLVWMKAASKQIHALQNNSQTTAVSHSSASTLSVVQDRIKQSTLAGRFTQLKQSENDSAQMSFQTVNFDELMEWLTKIGLQDGLVVSQISITPINAMGSISAEVTLKKS